jgi:hypothetical protein
LETAYRVALQYLAGLDTRRVAPAASYETLCARLGGPLPVTGVTAERIIDDLASGVEDGLMTSSGGRFFG